MKEAIQCTGLGRQFIAPHLSVAFHVVRRAMKEASSTSGLAFALESFSVLFSLREEDEVFGLKAVGTSAVECTGRLGWWRRLKNIRKKKVLSSLDTERRMGRREHVGLVQKQGVCRQEKAPRKEKLKGRSASVFHR